MSHASHKRRIFQKKKYFSKKKIKKEVFFCEFASDGPIKIECRFHLSSWQRSTKAGSC
jgi:hypothetical protein